LLAFGSTSPTAGTALVIRTCVERAVREGVVLAADFGAAVAGLVAGNARSAALHFDGGRDMTPAESV
jgi:hypothetical protein